VDGSLFQIRGAAEANERSPSVLRRVDGTTIKHEEHICLFEYIYICCQMNKSTFVIYKK
jgi:hypothetical protein